MDLETHIVSLLEKAKTYGVASRMTHQDSYEQALNIAIAIVHDVIESRSKSVIHNLQCEHSGPSDGEIYAAYSRRFEDPALRTAMIEYIRDVEDILRDDEA